MIFVPVVAVFMLICGVFERHFCAWAWGAAASIVIVAIAESVKSLILRIVFNRLLL